MLTSNAKGGIFIERNRKRVIWTLAALYAAAMLFLLFVRDRQMEGVPYLEQMKTHFNLIPFHTIMLFVRSLIRRTNPWYVRHAIINLAGNVILFIPMGFFPPLLCSKMDRLWKLCLSVFAVMTVIELLQMVLLVGTCDVDDLLLNVLGAALGYGLWRLLFRK